MRKAGSVPAGWVKLLVCLAGITLPGSTAFPAADDPAFEQTVAELLQQLDGPTRAERAAAEKKLLGLGTGVLKLLPPPELLPSLAVRDAANRIRTELERRHAQESVLVTRVTLKGQKPLREWLNQIRQETHNIVTMADPQPEVLEKPIDMIAARVPFWQALEELQKKAGLEFAAEQPAGAIQLAPRADEPALRPAAVAYSGPFRIESGSPRQRTVFGSRDRKILRFQLQLLAEPRLRPLFLQYSMSHQTATAIGKPNFVLHPLSPDAKYELPLAQGGRIPVQLDYVLPASPKQKGDAAKSRGKPAVPAAAAVDRKASLKGKLQATIAADSEEIRFKELGQIAARPGRPIARRRGGVTATLNRVIIKPAGMDKQDVAVRVSLSYDKGGPAFESHRTWMLHNRVYLQSPAGATLELNGGFETTLEANGEIALEYRFGGVSGHAGDYTFVYVAPTAIIDIPIEFDFEMLPVAVDADATKS